MHKHAGKMLEYANDAKKSDQPWLLWQVKRDGQWLPMRYNPSWDVHYQYRRRPTPLEGYALIREIPEYYLYDTEEEARAEQGGEILVKVRIEEID